MGLPSKLEAQINEGFEWGQQNPIEWTEEVLGVTLDPKQRDLLISLRDNERTDFKTGNEVGKTFGVACAGVQFLFCYPSSTVIVTSTTDRQLWYQYWPEVVRLYHGAKYKLPGKIVTKKITVDPKGKWFLLGFSTSEEAKFEGYHNKNILLIMDEAKGIREPIWRAGERLFRGEGVHKRWIAAGTPPLGPVGEFAQITINPKKSKLWNHIHCSGWDSLRVSNDKCQEALDTYGENNPFYISMVMGRVPTDAETTLLNLNDILIAMARKIGYGKHIDEVSCDVARKGKDETVISYRCGWKVFQDVYRGKDRTTHCVARIKKLLAGQKDAKEIPIRIDDIGVGGGVSDQLIAEGYYTVEINVARSAVRDDIYADLGTEIYAQMGDCLRDKPIDIPDDPELQIQLFQRTDTRIKAKGGRLVLKLLSKEELRKDPLHKGNPSPDRADSLALLLCEIPPPEGGKSNKKRVGQKSFMKKGSGGWTGRKAHGKKEIDRTRSFIRKSKKKW